MPAIKKPAHWLDILPALPLARGVPYVATWAPFTSKKPYRGVGGDLGPDLMKLNSDPKVRIDLESPAGFAYGLQLLIPSARRVAQELRPTGAATFRFWLGKTTDADRLALAQALAEVTS